MQLFQDPSGTGQIFRSLVILHQLFNDRRINPRLLAFLALFFSLLLLGHFHLLSQVVTHTQNFPTPSDKAIHRLKEKVRELWDGRQSKTSEELRQRWKQYIRGWWNYFELAECWQAVTNLNRWIRRHMRKCFWQRWHQAKGGQKALQRLGIRGRLLL